MSLLYPISGALSIASRRCGRTILQKTAGGDCHRQSFQKPKWSSIPRQCAHWHGIYWMRGCFRRKRRNPASLYQVRAGRILKEDGLVCGSKPFSASLSRILAELLGGTRSSPPEAPSRKFRQGFRPNPSVSATPSQLPFQGSLFRS